MQKKKRLDVWPNEPCHKCGGAFWQACVEPKTWGCAYCGNLAYFNYGSFRQQIDIVMASRRKGEFVKSTSKKSILPKNNSTLKKIKFKQELEVKRKARIKKQKEALNE